MPSVPSSIPARSGVPERQPTRTALTSRISPCASPRPPRGMRASKPPPRPWQPQSTRPPSIRWPWGRPCRARAASPSGAPPRQAASRPTSRPVPTSPSTRKRAGAATWRPGSWPREPHGALDETSAVSLVPDSARSERRPAPMARANLTFPRVEVDAGYAAQAQGTLQLAYWTFQPRPHHDSSRREHHHFPPLPSPAQHRVGAGTGRNRLCASRPPAGGRTDAGQ